MLKSVSMVCSKCRILMHSIENMPEIGDNTAYSPLPYSLQADANGSPICSCKWFTTSTLYDELYHSYHGHILLLSKWHQLSNLQSLRFAILLVRHDRFNFLWRSNQFWNVWRVFVLNCEVFQKTGDLTSQLMLKNALFSKRALPLKGPLTIRLWEVCLRHGYSRLCRMQRTKLAPQCITTEKLAKPQLKILDTWQRPWLFTQVAYLVV